jgi:peptidyl-prolyl cis-trans isomerase D
MYGKFRQAMISIGAKVLVALLVLSFAVWGIGDHLSFSGDGDANTVATVGEREIGRQEYVGEVQRQVSRLRRALGNNNITEDQLRSMGVSQRVLDGMISQAVFIEGARDMGLIVGEDTLAQEIRNDQRFRGAGGQFSRDQFNRILYENGYQEDTFINLFRADLIRSQLLSGIINGQTVPRTLNDAIHGYRMERRIADVISIPNRNLGVVKQPTDGELAKYHKDNAPRFTAPENRDFSLVRLQIEDVLDEVEVAEDKIRESYRDRLNEFTVLERRTIKQMLLNSEAEALKAHRALSSGTDFTKVAADIAKMDAEATELGEVSRDELPVPALADAAFDLAVLSVSQPIKSDLGWHILKITKISARKERAYDAVKAQIKKDIASEKAVEVLFKLANNFEDSLGGGDTLDDAARKLNFKVTKFTKTNRAGASELGTPVAGLDPEVVRVAFETEENNDSPLIDTGEGGYFILHLDKVTPPTLRPLKTVRSQVRDAMMIDRRAEVAGRRADSLIKNIQSGKDLAGLAKKFGGTQWTSKAFTRTGQGLERRLPGAVVAQVFSQRVGQTSTAGAGENQIIAVLKHIERANPLADKNSVEQISAQLNEGIGNDLTAQLAAALRGRFGVTVNQAAVDAPLSRGR